MGLVMKFDTLEQLREMEAQGKPIEL